MTREEAIEILEERWRYSKTYKYTDAEIREAFDMAIKALEQQPKAEQKWIPCTERLPESLMVKTLVSCEDANGLPINTMVAIYDAFSKTWDCEYKVIAWMPLPPSYQGEENG